jgi:hypothetical protein
VSQVVGHYQRASSCESVRLFGVIFASHIAGQTHRKGIGDTRAWGHSYSTGSFMRESCQDGTVRPNHALQRTRPSRYCSNPRVPCAGSLSLGR